MNHCNFGHPCSRKMIESKLSQGRASKVMMRLGTMERETKRALCRGLYVCIRYMREGKVECYLTHTLFNPKRAWKLSR